MTLLIYNRKRRSRSYLRPVHFAIRNGIPHLTRIRRRRLFPVQMKRWEGSVQVLRMWGFTTWAPNR